MLSGKSGAWKTHGRQELVASEGWHVGCLGEGKSIPGDGKPTTMLSALSITNSAAPGRQPSGGGDAGDDFHKVLTRIEDGDATTLSPGADLATAAHNEGGTFFGLSAGDAAQAADREAGPSVSGSGTGDAERTNPAVRLPTATGGEESRLHAAGSQNAGRQPSTENSGDLRDPQLRRSAENAAETGGEHPLAGAKRHEAELGSRKPAAWQNASQAQRMQAAVAEEDNTRRGGAPEQAMPAGPPATSPAAGTADLDLSGMMAEGGNTRAGANPSLAVAAQNGAPAAAPLEAAAAMPFDGAGSSIDKTSAEPVRLPPLPAGAPGDHLAESETARAEVAAERLMTNMRGGQGEARFRLTPEALGELDVRVSMEGGAPRIEFAVGDERALTVIESSLARLTDLLEKRLSGEEEAGVDADADDEGTPSQARSDGSGSEEQARGEDRAPHEPGHSAASGAAEPSIIKPAKEGDGRVRLFA